MSESKDKSVVFDGPEAFPNFDDPKWIAKKIKELGLDKEDLEFSARARKKKRIYKRKKPEDKPTV